MQYSFQEYEERLHLNYQRDTNIRRREKRMAIAEEKRRWQVLYYTRDGKPDKKRRPGRPWDPSIYAGAEKAIYSGGSGVDLTANTRQTKKTGSVQSVDNTLNQISLQTYLDEVQMYEQLLNPITSIMQNTMGGGMGGPGPPSGGPSVSLAQRGWGPEGDKIGPALEDIGALPADWKERRIKQEQTRSSAHSVASSANNTARSTDTSPSRPPRSILRRQSSYGIKGSAFGVGTSPRQLIIAPVPMFDGFDSGGSEHDQSSQVSETFSSVSDMFRNSARVRRKKKAVSYMPSAESFSSSYRSKVRSISTTNQMQYRFTGDNDAEEEDSYNTTPNMNRTNSKALVPLYATSPHSGMAQSSSRHANPYLTQQEHISAMVPPLQHLSDIVPLVHSSSAKYLNTGSTSSAAGTARAVPKPKKKREKGGSTIPWELLDQLDGEKMRFNNERAHIEFHSKL